LVSACMALDDLCKRLHLDDYLAARDSIDWVLNGGVERSMAEAAKAEAERAAAAAGSAGAAGAGSEGGPPLKVHASAIVPGWKFEDFFRLDSTQEISIRKQLANYLGLRYGEPVNKAKPFAASVSGVPAYCVDLVKKQLDEYNSLNKALSSKEWSESSESARQLEPVRSMSLVVSGLLVAWNTHVPINEGYVQAWRDQNLDRWDTGVERKAGGLDVNSILSAQHFHCTNRSSLMAMLASVVCAFKSTGSIPQALRHAFCSIRVLLYFGASPDEIMVPSGPKSCQGLLGAERCLA